MPYIPYCNAPVAWSIAHDVDNRRTIAPAAQRPSAHPPMLEFLQNPRGLLALNLAATAYWHARVDGLRREAALESADAELATVSGNTDDGLAEWVAFEPPNTRERQRDAANDDEARREVA